jgi:sporulation protein YlmC with PRC-barrel domain
MKKLMLSTAFLAATGVSALAQDGTATFRAAADPMEIRASEFIGMRLYASEAAVADASANGVQDGWEDIGEINDVILARDGSVDAVLVDVGGFLGMGERQVAVDMPAIRFVADDATPEELSDYFLVTNASRVLIEAAPEYTDSRMTDTAAMETSKSMDPANPAATADTMREPMLRDGYSPATPEQMTTEMLTGTPVYDANEESVGDVAQLNIDSNGAITEAIVDVGGFLGIGTKAVALPLSDLDILRQDDGDDLRVYVSMTKEQMEALPTYEE